MRSVELFAGAGGLALGTSLAGFRHDAVIERDEDACETISENQRLGVVPVASWPKVLPNDIRHFDFSAIKPNLELISGGVPCQPWSQGGLHLGPTDERNLFPDVVKIVRELRPKAILIENVKGLTRKIFHNYFEYIKHQLRYPEITRRRSESWTGHLGRLERQHTSARSVGLSYRLVTRLVNAANFGVPQRRERVFIVAFRSDLGVEWRFPDETHSQEALLWDQWVSHDYWQRYSIPVGSRKAPPTKHRTKVAQLKQSLVRPSHAPWLTVRDAIWDLPDPCKGSDQSAFPNHVHNPGARSYPGHTGSPLDEPAKTLKAGVHGVPGGENTICYADGNVRYFTVREAARIQTFPDNYVFHSSWTESMRQIGNAVPVTLARLIAADIARHLKPMP